MEEEPMEIDDTLPTGVIIEARRDDDIVIIDGDEPEAVAPPARGEKQTTATDADVVILDDDDDCEAAPTGEEPKEENAEECTVIDLVGGKKSCNTRCINYACGSGKDTMIAPGLCLQYYRVKNSENNRRQVCRECYMMALSHYETLAGALTKGDSVFKVDFPLRNDMFEIDDSESEDEDADDGYDQECVEFLEKEFTEILEKSLNEYKFNEQAEDGVKVLVERAKPLAEGFKKIDADLKDLRKRLDHVQLNLYRQFPVSFKEETPIEIVEEKAVVQRKTGECALV